MPIGSATSKLTVVLSAVDKTKAGFKGAEQGLSKFGKAANIAAGAALAVGAAIGVKAVKAAATFEKGMGNVATLVDTSTESIEQMGKAVLDISKRVPVSSEDLVTALYDVRSAGISASEAMGVLETSGKLAVAGLSTTQEATNLLTSAINVYGDETHDANALAEILFKTVKAGKTTIAELSQGFGKVAAIAKETGISIEDLSAATAILTTGGIKAAEAQTSLKAMIANVLKPTKAAKDAAESLGIQFDLGALQAKGLSGMLQEIALNAGEDKQVLADLFGSVEAANAIFALTSEEGGAALVKVLKDMEVQSGALDEAFKKQTETTAAQYELFKNNLNVILIELGTKILPIVIKAMEMLMKVIEGTFAFIDKWAESIVGGFEKIRKVGESVKRFFGGTVAGDVVGATTERMAEINRSRAERGLPPMQQGTPYVPKTGPFLLHKGERVVPAEENARGGGSNVFNFNFAGAIISNKEEFAQQIMRVVNRETKFSYLNYV